eukprot:CAMPEP_0196660478 /NCGR_PEP_ID=MMETSP1086-20130531/39942_1 /TAXON_ID=77921 /ORGANISM="Cyanoptyche  gloeocystis , Strain SAG4.97" /LENGTH=59 /DNA_ID=CAMNT_0041994907 /DNA_START=265 /DNA_END=441 /DNA_ORIENTATION=+
MSLDATGGIGAAVAGTKMWRCAALGGAVKVEIGWRWRGGCATAPCQGGCAYDARVAAYG